MSLKEQGGEHKVVHLLISKLQNVFRKYNIYIFFISTIKKGNGAKKEGSLLYSFYLEKKIYGQLHNHQ